MNASPSIPVAAVATNGVGTGRTFLVIVLLAVAIRLGAWGLMDMIFRDTVSFISQAGRIETILSSDEQEPLYPVLIWGTHKLLFPHDRSVNPVRRPFNWELVTFIIGMSATVIALVTLFAIGREIHSPAAGLWGAFFLAIQPYGIHYAIGGLSELPYLMFVLLAVYVAIKAVRGRRALLVLTGVCTVLAFLVRKEGIAVTAAIGTYLLFEPRVPLSRRIKSLATFLVGLIGALLIYCFIGGRFNWLAGHLRMLGIDSSFVGSAAVPSAILASVWLSRSYEIVVLPLIDWVKLTGGLPAILVLIFFARFRRFQLRAGVGLLLCCLLFHLIVVFTYVSTTTLYVKRYFFPAAVIVFPIAGAVLAGLIAGQRAERRRRLGIIVIVAMIVVLTTETSRHYLPHQGRHIRSAASWLAENTGSDAFILSEDNRVGFYSGRRQWRITGTKPDNPVWLAQREGFDHSYFVFRADKDEGLGLKSWLDYVNGRAHLQPHCLQTFESSRGTLVVYQVQVVPSSSPPSDNDRR